MDSSGNNPPGAASVTAPDSAIDAPRETALHAPPLPDANDQAPASVTTLWALYALEVVAIGILRIPHDLNLFMFAFGDRGSWLVAQYLTAHGARPTIDFGFPYGLLPLLFGRAWFAIFGLTPAAFDAAMMAGGVAMAFGIARFANAMRLGRVGQLLIVLALPVAIQSSMPGFAHLLEAVALCLAIGEHARGNRGAALALATAACFTKAALGYLYGLLLLVSIVAHCRRAATGKASTDDRRSTLRTPAAPGPGATLSDAPYSAAHFDWPELRHMLMPAAITAVILIAIVTPVFGVRPVIASLLPLNGMKIYQSQHFSFFSPWGRSFWDPRAQPLGRYFATVAPFWLGSTIWLAVVGLLAGWRLSQWPLFAATRRSSPLADDRRVAAPFAEPRRLPSPTIDNGIDDGTSRRPHEIAAVPTSHPLTPSRLWSSPPNEVEAVHLRDEIVFCCAILQTLFVLRFFGPPTSWTYYPYIVVMGVAAASRMNSVTARVTMMLVFVVFVAQDANLVGMSSLWKTSAPSAITAGSGPMRPITPNGPPSPASSPDPQVRRRALRHRRERRRFAMSLQGSPRMRSATAYRRHRRGYRQGPRQSTLGLPHLRALNRRRARIPSTRPPTAWRTRRRRIAGARGSPPPGRSVGCSRWGRWRRVDIISATRKAGRRLPGPR